MACAHLFVGEGRLHIELNAEHGPPRREVLKQLLGAPGLADHHTAAGLRTMGAADQFETIEAIQNQLIGLLGLVALAAGTAVEAGLAAKKSRQQN